MQPNFWLRSGSPRAQVQKVMAALGDLYYLAREGEDGELNARTPSRSDLFTTKTVPIGDGRELVASERAVSAAAHHQALLDRCGLTFLSSGTTAPLEALRDPERVMSTAYFQETEQMLLDHLPDVGYAFAFNFVNRQSDLLVHTLPASDKSARGPVNDVHSDFTAESFVIKGIEQRQEQLGLSGARCMIVNIWRPLCAPGESVSSWPLTVCDASSVRCASRGGKSLPPLPRTCWPSSPAESRWCPCCMPL